MRTLEIREPRREKVELENTTTTKSYRLGTVLLGIRRIRKPPKGHSSRNLPNNDLD